MTAQLAHRLTQRGAGAGERTAMQLADAIRTRAGELAPGRLGEALAVLPAEGGADLTAPGYARFVEFGTRKMQARPFLRPALEEARTRLRAGRS